MVSLQVRTGGELLLGAVEEVQHVGDLLPEPGKGVVVVIEVELAELAEALAELHHRAAVVLHADPWSNGLYCWSQIRNNSSIDFAGMRMQSNTNLYSSMDAGYIYRRIRMGPG